MAALLKDRGADVALLDYRADRATEIQERGIRVEQEGRTWNAPVPCAADPDVLGVADVLVLLVKAYSTGQAIFHAEPCVGPKTAVLTLQNGLGNYETIAEHVGPERTLAGTIVMGCASLGVGHVRIAGVGEMAVGSPAGNQALADSTAQLLQRWWPSARSEADVEAALWRKVIVNAAINPLTAITGLPNGALVEDDELRATLGLIAKEAAGVAEALGVEAYADVAAEAAEEVCRITAGNRSSMLQDIVAGRRTEIRQICGEIVRRGRAAGIAAPLCQAMTALVAAIEKRDH